MTSVSVYLDFNLQLENSVVLITCVLVTGIAFWSLPHLILGAHSAYKLLPSYPPLHIF